MKRVTWVLVAAALLVPLAGCGEKGGGEEKGGTETGVMALTSDLDGNTDVTAIQFVITRVSCGDGDEFDPLTVDVTSALEDMRLSGEVPEEGNPLDDDSGHIFADQFFNLPPGCYDVLTQPLNAAGAPSEDCALATASGVQVFAGQTTEILLINQCEGEDDGALDVISVLNHPPDLIGPTYNPSKFVFECEYNEICATASDPDNDPLEFVWEQISGPALASGIEVTRTERVGNVWTQCVRVAASEVGTVEFLVTVYDLGETEDGAPIRMEELLALQGNPAPSRATLSFPMHSNVGLELFCVDADSGAVRPMAGVRLPLRAEGCEYATPEDVYCNPENPWYTVYCPDGQFDPSAVYPTCLEAACPAEIVANTLDTVTLTADPAGISGTYAWEVVSQPEGSTSTPTPADALTTELLLDIAGDFVLQFTVTDEFGSASSCQTQVRSIPSEQFRVELLWNVGADVDNSDLDLHLLNFNEGMTWETENDCHFRNCGVGALEWGAPGLDNDPRLDVDDVSGFGPENINVDDPEDGTYRVGVHFWRADVGTADAIVRIYCNSTLAREFGPQTLQADAGANDPANDFWMVADVTWSGDDCTVTEIGDVVPEGTIRPEPPP